MGVYYYYYYSMQFIQTLYYIHFFLGDCTKQKKKEKRGR